MDETQCEVKVGREVALLNGRRYTVALSLLPLHEDKRCQSRVKPAAACEK